MKNKKAWLDELYYDIGKQNYDFFLCGTYEKDGEKLFTKWKKYSECIFPINFDGTCNDWKVQKFFEGINQRQIGKIEVVLDIENKKQVKDILNKLEKKGWEYTIWDTGSRGYHIHLFFKEEVNQKEKTKIIKFFKVDEQKASDKCLIALENEEHWKGKGIKTEINKEEILNGK